MNSDQSQAKHIIQGLWIKGSLSPLEQLSISSFLKNGHEFHLYTYEPVDNVPIGTTILPAQTIVPDSQIFEIQVGWGKGSLAIFSDYFRYKLLHAKGGWWVDLDIVCLQPFEAPKKYVFASSYEGSQGDLPVGCVLHAPAGDPLIRTVIDEIEKRDFSTVGYSDLGPHMVQKIVRENKLQEFVTRSEVFCPLGWRSVGNMVYSTPANRLIFELKHLKRQLTGLLKPDFRIGKITQNSRAVHFWHEVWRQQGIDKWATFDENCLFEKLKKRYLGD